MATSVSTTQQAVNSTYTAAAAHHYTPSYSQGYQPNAYSYQPWSGATGGYDQNGAYATGPVDTRAPPPPGTEPPATSSAAALQQPDASQHYDANAAAYYQQHQDYYQQQQQQHQQYYQYYGQYPTQQYYPGYGYATPAQSQASAAQWSPAATQAQQTLQQPATTAYAPTQTAVSTPQATAVHYATQAASGPLVQPGYMLMPDGKYKPVPKEDEQAKPLVIKPNMPKRKFSGLAAAATAQPAYTKVEEAKKSAGDAATAGQAGGFPPSLRRLVERSFNDHSFKGPNKAACEAALKGMINDAQARGEMWTRDWDSVPVPGSVASAPLATNPLPAPASPAAKQTKWGVQVKAPVQTKAAAQFSQAAHRSPARSVSSYSSDSDRSYSRSRSRTRSPYSRGRSRSPSPESSYRRGPARGSRGVSNADYYGRQAKKAGPPEPSKKQRKRERKQAQWEAKQKTSGKKSKAAALAQADSDGPTYEELHKRELRHGRFGQGGVDQSSIAKARVPVYAAELATGPAGDEGDREDSWGHYVVQGTCLTLEKKYFRLTGPPDPSVIRPPQVLKAALKRVVHMYRAGTCDMHYTEDQLKAMRQDVTVQHVKGSLPVQIYEAHARACLEHGNGGDFNQCQTRLKVLYEEGGQGCVEEFVAYRIIYHAILRGKESASLLQEMEHLSPQVMRHPAVAHALKLRQSLVYARFKVFFQLYAAAPNLGRALMDLCFVRVRFAALEIIVEACKVVKVKVQYLAAALGFWLEPASRAQPHVAAQPSAPTSEAPENSSNSMALPGCRHPSFGGKHPAEADAESAMLATIAWLRACNAVVLPQGDSPYDAVLDCKACTGLKKPAEASAVSHGDATLNLEAFMHQVFTD